MPPKVKTDKNMILEAAFDIVRESGVDNLNARNIASRLGCSTQPVLYHFKTIDEIRNEVYMKVDEFHSEYLMSNMNKCQNPMQAIGENYIRFGHEEKNLFRFLFQTNSLEGQIQSLVDDERLTPILGAMAGQMNCSMDEAKKQFMVRFATVHGLASLLANNRLEYDEELNMQIMKSLK